jgi:hypothetical protein
MSGMSEKRLNCLSLKPGAVFIRLRQPNQQIDVFLIRLPESVPQVETAIKKTLLQEVKSEAYV